MILCIIKDHKWFFGNILRPMLLTEDADHSVSWSHVDLFIFLDSCIIGAWNFETLGKPLNSEEDNIHMWGFISGETHGFFLHNLKVFVLELLVTFRSLWQLLVYISDILMDQMNNVVVRDKSQLCISH